MPGKRGEPGERLYQVGKYWIGRIEGRPNLYRFHYNGRTRQVTRVSLGTSDLQEACRALDAWFIANHAPRQAQPDQIALTTVLLRYYENHAKRIPSADQQRIALGLWTEFFGASTVADLTPVEQDRFIAWLGAKEYSKGYISRTLSVGRAALRYAWRQQELASAPFVKDVMTRDDRRQVEPKGRPLSLTELATLLDAAESDYLFLFCLLTCNTLARPRAVLDLTPGQYDAEHGLIHLNPPGRKQTKKWRPTVPVTRTLRPWIVNAIAAADAERAEREERGEDNGNWTPRLVMYNGQPIQSIKRTWRKLRVKAGLVIPNPAYHPEGDKRKVLDDPTVNPYSFRHTMARELRRRRVPGDEISLMLGHMPDGSSATTSIYAPYSPDYCSNAVAAIDAVFEELQDKMSRQVLPLRALENERG